MIPLIAYIYLLSVWEFTLIVVVTSYVQFGGKTEAWMRSKPRVRGYHRILAQTYVNIVFLYVHAFRSQRSTFCPKSNANINQLKNLAPNRHQSINRYLVCISTRLGTVYVLHLQKLVNLSLFGHMYHHNNTTSEPTSADILGALSVHCLTGSLSLNSWYLVMLLSVLIDVLFEYKYRSYIVPHVIEVISRFHARTCSVGLLKPNLTTSGERGEEERRMEERRQIYTTFFVLHGGKAHSVLGSWEAVAHWAKTLNKCRTRLYPLH